MILIGLAGLARSGKDTAAEVLASDLNLHRYAFADPMKRMLEQVFGDNFVSGDRERIEPISGVSYRKLMQTLGTEWGRSVHPELWTRVAMAKWEWVKGGCPIDTQGVRPGPVGMREYKLPMPAGMIISDVRFDNEADWIRSVGGKVIHIRRPGDRPVGVEGHVSEHGVTPHFDDWFVVNGGTLDFFKATVSGLAKAIKMAEDH